MRHDFRCVLRLGLQLVDLHGIGHHEASDLLASGVEDCMRLPLNEIVHGDCLEVLKTLPDESVSAVVCDPPIRFRSTRT
jgi:hypothetical protein